MIVTSSHSPPSHVLNQSQPMMVTHILYAFFKVIIISSCFHVLLILCLKLFEIMVYTFFIFHNTQHMVRCQFFFYKVMLRTFEYSLKLVSLPASIDALFSALLCHLPQLTHLIISQKCRTQQATLIHSWGCTTVYRYKQNILGGDPNLHQHQVLLLAILTVCTL